MTTTSTPLHILLDGLVYILEAPPSLTSEDLEWIAELRADRALVLLETWLESNPLATEAELRSKGAQIYATVELTPDRSLDPVFAEALTMARELILAELAKQGLPAPKSLEMHAKAVVESDPTLRERARRRVEARIEVGRTALRDVEARAGVV